MLSQYIYMSQFSLVTVLPAGCYLTYGSTLLPVQYLSSLLLFYSSSLHSLCHPRPIFFLSLSLSLSLYLSLSHTVMFGCNILFCPLYMKMKNTTVGLLYSVKVRVTNRKRDVAPDTENQFGRLTIVFLFSWFSLYLLTVFCHRIFPV